MAAWKKGQSGNPSGRPRKQLRRRSDGWENLFTGLGVSGRDKRLASTFLADRFDYEECRERWRGDDMGARIVEVIPEEMVRAGFDVQIQPDETAAQDQRTDALPPPQQAPVAPPPKAPPGEIEPPDEEPKAMAEAVEAKYEELGGPSLVELAMCYARAYGGGAVMLGVDDGREMWRPVNETGIRSIRWLNALSPQELRAEKYYTDPRAPRYGEPEVYLLNSSGLPDAGFRQARIHESRLLVFRGPVLDRRHMVEMQGWGDSVFSRVDAVLRDFQITWSSAAVLMQDFAQAVYKMAGLAELMAANEESVVAARIKAFDMARSVLKMALIDDQDDIERKQTPVTGLPEMLDKFSLRLAAAVEIPVTRLMGQAPAGLNATGASDIRFFYDTIAAKQEKYLRPQLERMVRYLMLAKDGPTKGREPENWSIEFCPLWQMSDKEQAEVREIQSRTDKAYIDSQVVTPEEVTASRFGGDRWSPDTVIDFEARKKLAVEHTEAKERYAAERGKQEITEETKA